MRIVALLVLLLAACAGQADNPVMQPPTDAPTDAGAGGGGQRLSGVLGGDAQLEGGCAWLQEGDTRWEVQYPQGYTISFDPLTLTAPDGSTATDGDTVTVTGAPAEDVMTVCQVGPVWAADSVELGG